MNDWEIVLDHTQQVCQGPKQPIIYKDLLQDLLKIQQAKAASSPTTVIKKEAALLLKLYRQTVESAKTVKKESNNFFANIWDMYKQATLMEIAAHDRDLKEELQAAQLLLDGSGKVLDKATDFAATSIRTTLAETGILFTYLSYLTFLEEERAEMRNLNRSLMYRFQNAKLNIYVPRHKLYNNDLIECRGEIRADNLVTHCHEVKLLIACSHFDKLRNIPEAHLSPQERSSGTINIMNHFNLLMQNPAPVPFRAHKGLLTFQNGINNTMKDFKDMGMSIINKYKSAHRSLPLCIGLYNPSFGFSKDFLGRLLTELRGYLSDNVCYTRQMLSTFVDLLSTQHPDVVWTHIAHSEAGLLANLAFESLPKKYTDYTKKHLIAASYGAVQPFRLSHALKTYNNYATKDIALFFGKKYKKQDKEYEIDIIKSIKPKNGSSFPLIEGDHAFMGDTYQEKLQENIIKIHQEPVRI